MIRRPSTILALLTGLNLLNYLDRFVLAAVLPAMMPPPGVDPDGYVVPNDFWGGALATVFLVGYFATSPIFGALSDRGSRRGLIAIGIAVWSLATVGSGLAPSLPWLIVARVLVGVGEASYATIAPTLIDDIAPPAKKGRWLAIFYAAMPIGAALGYLIGGFVVSRWEWSTAFYVAGGPGLLLAGLCLLIKEPVRTASPTRPSPFASLKALARIPVYRKGVLGYAAYTFAVGGFSYWAPRFLEVRYEDLGADQATRLGVANFRFGVVTVIGGALGTALGGLLGDYWTRRRIRGLGAGITDAERDRIFVHENLRVCALSAVLGAPFALAAFFAPSSTVFFALALACEIGIFLSSSPINIVVLRSVPEAQRGAAMALSIFAIHLLGDLWSPPLIGALAGVIEREWAMMLIPAAIVVAAIVWMPGRQPVLPPPADRTD